MPWHNPDSAKFLLILSALVWNANANECRLYGRTKNNLFDECDLVKDRLQIDLKRITSTPDCVANISLVFSRSKTALGQASVSFRHGSVSEEIENPLQPKDRCTPTTLHVGIQFIPKSRKGEDFNLELNPMDYKCWWRRPHPRKGQKEGQQKAVGSRGVDLSLRWSESLWNSCLDFVTLENKDLSFKDLSRKEALQANVLSEVCVISYNFFGGKERIPHEIEQLGVNEQIIKDCDLFEDEIEVAIDKMINKPRCTEKIEVKIGTSLLVTSSDRVTKKVVKIANNIKTQNLCAEVATKVTIRIGPQEYSSDFKLNTLKCFKAEEELQFEEDGKENILVNLTQGISDHEQLWEKCLTSIKIYDQDETEVPFKEMPGYSHLVKISSLNRHMSQTLTVEYNFRGNVKRTKQFLVPSSEQQRVQQPDSGQSANDRVLLTAIICSSVATLTVTLSIVAIVVVFIRCMKRKRNIMKVDRNEDYGFYYTAGGERLDQGVDEIVHTNDYYG